MSGFADVVAGCAEAASKVSAFDSKWRPPAGEYTVQITKVDEVEFSKEPGGMLQVVFDVLGDGEYSGRKFADSFFFYPGDEDRSYMGTVGIFRLASCLAKTDISDLPKAVKIVNDAVGSFLNVESFESESKGKTYRNIRYLSVLAEDS